jgi:NAD(P)H dehydrogenase (quinone)
VSPNWRWCPPALPKGFIDCVFWPGFAVEYLDGFPFNRKLLKGRSARAIYTQNSTQWLGVLARGDLFWRLMRRRRFWDTAASLRFGAP